MRDTHYDLLYGGNLVGEEGEDDVDVEAPRGSDQGLALSESRGSLGGADPDMTSHQVLLFGSLNDSSPGRPLADAQGSDASDSWTALDHLGLDEALLGDNSIDEKPSTPASRSRDSACTRCLRYLP